MDRLPRPKVSLAAILAFLLSAGCVSAPKAQPQPTPTAAEAQNAPPKSNSIWPVSFQEITNEVSSLVVPGDAPAAGLICMWQTHISHLSDPTKNGHMSPGLAGQVFLLDAAEKPTKANGKLTVDLYDETSVRHGGEAKLIERWVFDRDTLKKLAASDEIFGRNYTLFLPWPGYKPEINHVRIMVKYEPENGHPVYAPAAPLTIGAQKAVVHMQNETMSMPPSPGMPPRGMPGGFQSTPFPPATR